MKMHALLIITFLLLTGFIMQNQYEEYHLSKGEQLVNGILAKTAKIIKEKYDVKPSGVGVAMPGGPIQELTLCFDTKYPYTQEQLRELLIKASLELLDNVNNDNSIQEFLKERPFTIKNIQVIIYNHDRIGREVYVPGISGAQIAQGILTYRTVDKDDTFKFKDQFEESYEEALKKYRNNRLVVR